MARILAVSCLPVTPGDRALLLWTQCNAVSHRARINGADQHEHERFARTPTGKNIPGWLKLAIDSLPLIMGGYTLVFKILSVEVLHGMSTLRLCKGISTARYSRVRDPWRNRAYGARIPCARVIVIALMRGDIARGTHFPVISVCA